MTVTSNLGINITLPIIRIDITNDAFPSTDTTSLGVRDSINVFAANAGFSQSMQFRLIDFLSVGSGNDPNNALNSLSLADAFSGLNLDPFVQGDPWSRGTIGFSGQVDGIADFNSVVATGGNDPAVVPLPAALPLFGTGLAMLGFFGWRRKRKAAA